MGAVKILPNGRGAVRGGEETPSIAFARRGFGFIRPVEEEKSTDMID
jgi:hypothetical protein